MMEFKYWSNVFCASRLKAGKLVDSFDLKAFREDAEKQDSKPESELQRGFHSKYVYGAPRNVPEQARQERFEWAT